MTPSKKQRLDLVMVERQLVPTRAKAQALIMAGDVSVGGESQLKAGMLVDPGAEIVPHALGAAHLSGFHKYHFLNARLGHRVHDPDEVRRPLVAPWAGFRRLR